MQPALARPLAAELVGTFALVFAGAGAIIVDSKTHQLGHVGVAITFAPHALWLYLVAPLLGAALGALVYQFIRREHQENVA